MKKAVCTVAVLLLPLMIFASSAYEFDISEYDYFIEDTTFESNNIQPDEFVNQKRSESFSNTNLEAESYITQKADKEKPLYFGIRAGLSYPAVANEQWHNAIEPLADINVSFLLPEVKGRVFGFSVEVGADYKLCLSKKGYEFIMHSLNFSLPLVFSFYFLENQKISLTAGAYYGLDIMLHQNEVSPKNTYCQDVFGINLSIRYQVKIASCFTVGLQVSGDIPLTKGAFACVKPGLIMDWRI